MSSISSLNSYARASLYSTNSTQRQRPDTSKMVNDLFAKLDTDNQGYLEASDFAAAFSTVSEASATSTTDPNSSSTASTDAIFKALDTNGDGKVTKEEMSSVLDKLSSELDSQFDQMRMAGAMQGAGGMPPPPPADSAGSDEGYTQEELTAKASKVASTDSKGAAMFSTLAANFEDADTNSDGKVSFAESQAYLQSQNSSSDTSSTTSSNSSSSATSTASNDADAKILWQIMELLRTYKDADTSTNSLLGSISVTA